MPFINSVILLMALVLAVCVPILGGYGISEHSGSWILIGLGCGAVAAALLVAHVKLLGRRGDAHGH